MSNSRSVSAAIQARLLADLFQHGSVANRPAVDSGLLRQAVAPVTFQPPAEKNGEGQ